MSPRTVLLALALLLPGAAAAAQHEPAAPAPGAEAGHGAPAAQAGSDAHAEPDAGAIFIGLFKHLEPHPVTAVWLGGGAGALRVLKPYAADAAGAPLHTDEHGHAVPFHSRAELEQHYAADMGGGFGVLVYNINTVQWLAGGLLLALMLAGAASARRQAGQPPRGRAYHLLESIVLFVRDDMVYAVMGKHHGRGFVPLFLTQFFFILFMNLLGLLWLGSIGGTATANVAVTATLAITTFVAIHLSGIREHGFFKHWKNFIPHGVPAALVPLMFVIEVIGMLVKPFALTIRLFANMTAGHLVMLSFFGLVYLFGAAGVPALAMAIGISALELFVCFVQAYIFTYLSIIFVGASVHPEH